MSESISASLPARSRLLRLWLTPSGEPRWTALLALAALVACGVALESCATMRKLVAGPNPSELKFSHAKHAGHAPDCKTCHVSDFSGDVIPAAHAACAACHEAAREENMPAKGEPGDRTCLLCHHSTSPGAAPRAPRPSYADANFDHAAHAAVDCAQCHGNVNAKRLGASADFPTMEQCVACHFPGLKEMSKADCLLCHPSITAKEPPKSHLKAEWKPLAHGPAALEREDLCARCHVKELDCDTCHARERPPSHTPAFRAKTHGFHATSNPNKCEICHTQEFCESCHRTTEPMNHTPAFKGRPFLHCATCHLPLEEGNGCAVCHQGDPHEKVVAPPPPPFLVEAGLIGPGQPCLPCHPVEQVPITHPYNTIPSTECIECHRPL